MTSLESLVPRLDICQQLKDAGFPQDTAMVWVKLQRGWSYQLLMTRADAKTVVHVDEIAAPTAEEILRELPVLIRIGDNIAGLQAWLSTSSDFAFYVGWQRYHPYREKEDPWHGADKESEAAALAYLWWKEQP